MGMRPKTDLGIPDLKWGSPNPHTKTGIPESKWGCESQTIPKPIRGSPNQNGDKDIPIPKPEPRIGLGIVQSLTHSDSGFIPIWDFRVLSPIVPKLERHSKRGPHIGTGIPESVRVGICQYFKLGSPHSNSGFIPIWGPTSTYFYYEVKVVLLLHSKSTPR